MLRFAGQMILREVHEKNYKWTWKHFAKRRDDRKRYVELFKKRESDKNKTLTGEVSLILVVFRIASESLGNRTWLPLKG
jgi:hypothetical protein